MEDNAKSFISKVYIIIFIIAFIIYKLLLYYIKTEDEFKLITNSNKINQYQRRSYFTKNKRTNNLSILMKIQ